MLYIIRVKTVLGNDVDPFAVQADKLTAIAKCFVFAMVSVSLSSVLRWTIAAPYFAFVAFILQAIAVTQMVAALRSIGVDVQRDQ